MVEFGIIKVFLYDYSKHFGFLNVLDSEGHPTIEDMFLHISDGVYPELDETTLGLVLGDFTERGLERLRMPRIGDRIAFVRSQDAQGRTRAEPWTYEQLWRLEERKLLTDPLEWRLIIETLPGQNCTEIPDITTVRHGEALPAVIRTFTGQDLGLCAAEASRHQNNGNSVAYELQIKADSGYWTPVRQITPYDGPADS
jgi:hypothetical protein